MNINAARFNFLYIVLLGSVFQTCQQNDQPVKANSEYQNNRSTHFLQGNVKSIQEFNYHQSVPDSFLWYYVTKEYLDFDETGNVTREVQFLLQESFHTDYRFEYDAAGNHIKQSSYDEDGKLKFLVTTKFDSEGRLLEYSEVKKGNITFRDVWEYEELPDGVFIRKKRTHPGEHIWNEKVTFDSVKRERIRVQYKDDQPDERWRKTISYLDERGNVLTENEYDDADRITEQYFRAFNERNQRTFSAIKSSRHSYSELFWTFDSLGNETSYKDVLSGVISIKSYRTKYRFDNRGNWIYKETFTWDGSPRTSLERKIEYYD